MEFSRFDAPAGASDHRSAPVIPWGYLHVIFTVDDLDETLARLRGFGAAVGDDVVDRLGAHRLAILRTQVHGPRQCRHPAAAVPSPVVVGEARQHGAQLCAHAGIGIDDQYGGGG